MLASELVVFVDLSVLWVAFAVIFAHMGVFFSIFGSGGQFGPSLGPDLASRANKYGKHRNFNEIWLQRGPLFGPLAALGALGGPDWRPRGGKRCAPRLKVTICGRRENGDISMCF